MSTAEKSVLDRCLMVYFKSLDKMKENIRIVYENYHQMIKEKMECDTGERLVLNTQNFENAVINALDRCDELETQLMAFESWIDLPINNPLDPTSSFDEVSEDAQRLVAILQQVQSAMLSAVTRESLNDALPEREAWEVLRSEATASGQPKPQAPMLHVASQNYLASELPSASASFLPAYTQNECQENDAVVPLENLNPTISLPLNSFTPPNLQIARAGGEVSSPYGHQQPFGMNRTGSDSNLMAQQQFMQQQQQEGVGGMHLQGFPKNSTQPHSNPGSYGY